MPSALHCYVLAGYHIIRNYVFFKTFVNFMWGNKLNWIELGISVWQFGIVMVRPTSIRKTLTILYSPVQAQWKFSRTNFASSCGTYWTIYWNRMQSKLRYSKNACNSKNYFYLASPLGAPWACTKPIYIVLDAASKLTKGRNLMPICCKPPLNWGQIFCYCDRSRWGDTGETVRRYCNSIFG